MPQFTIRQDGENYLTLSRQQDAVNHAEKLLADLKDGELSTFTIEDANGHLLATVTNRDITGRFIKQQWFDDYACDVGEESFEATNYILQMSLDDVRALTDSSQQSADVGQVFVQWDGLFQVILAEEVKSFFGVDDLEKITAEALQFAKERLNVKPDAVETVELTIKVRVRVEDGADVSEFVDNLDYSVFSNTSGVYVIDTEIVDSN